MVINSASVRIFIIEEEELGRTAFALLLSSVEQLSVVGSSANLENARGEIDRMVPDVVIVKLEFFSEAVIQSLRLLKTANPSISIIAMIDAINQDAFNELVRINVSGICCSKLSVSCLLAGIQATAAGSLWLGPRAMDYFRAFVASSHITDDTDKRARLVDAGLTERENEILRCLARGMTNQQIAAHLQLSVETVKTYVRRIMDKSSIRTRHQLTALLAPPGIPN